MKTNQIVNYQWALLLMATLTMLWGCSSDSDGDNDNGSKQNFTQTPVSQKPTWKIDWSSDVAAPDWQDPDPTKYECSMNLLYELDEETAPFSTDDDMMAVFMNGECRGVSYPNRMSDGVVAFLLHVKGSSEETADQMELRYYCAGLRHMTITYGVPPFIPNYLMDETYESDLNIGNGSQKYPLLTELSVLLPEKLPFTVYDDDMLAVFVGDECRGIGSYDPELFTGWRVNVYSAHEDEEAYVRYYSAQNDCIYTFPKTFLLNGMLQCEEITF
jgi:hypothetical protein